MTCKCCGKEDHRTNPLLGGLYCIDCSTKPLYEKQEALKESEAVEGHEKEAA